MEFWTDRVSNEVLHRVEGREEHLAVNKKKEGWLDWSHLAYGLPSGTIIERKIDGRIN